MEGQNRPRRPRTRVGLSDERYAGIYHWPTESTSDILMIGVSVCPLALSLLHRRKVGTWSSVDFLLSIQCDMTRRPHLERVKVDGRSNALARD